MIHKFSQNGFFFVLDIASGSIHVVDETVYDIVDLCESKKPDEIMAVFKNKHEPTKIIECIDEINELKESGLLFSKDIYENIPAKDVGSPVVKALCMHMAHDCNLRCGYCFGEGGGFGGERGLMPLSVAKASIDFILANSGNRKNLEIDFFGGEPLLNFSVLKETVAYARQKEKSFNKKINFTLTTNGVLLNEETNRYINENMQNVVLSLDGRKDVNDKMRKTTNQKGSYETIVPKLKELVNSREHKGYYVRGTFTSENKDFTEDVLHLNSLGFKQISVEPVVAREECGYSIKEADLDKIYAQYEKLCYDMLEADKNGCGFEFFHFNVDLDGGPCVYKRLAGCGAGTEYLAVTPTGDLYPCHQLAGNKKYLIGSVWDGIVNLPVRDLFLASSVYTKEKCKDCWAKFYCGGGCAANAININSDINEPYEIGCKLMRKRTECAILYKYCLTKRSQINIITEIKTGI